MKKYLLGTVGAACLLLGMASASQAADCGTVNMADMNWQSAEVLAAVDRFILTNGYGCTVDSTTGDPIPLMTSMSEKGQPDIIGEAWIGLLPDAIKRGTDEGKLVIAAKSLPDGGQSGWWIPKYLADANPDIKTIRDALKRPDLFPDPEDPSKGAIFNGPQGWGGTIATANLYKAFEADKAGFTLVDSGSAAGLDGSITRAYERKQGWIGYYWSPTALLGKYEMVRLDNGVPRDEEEWKRCTSVADCADPKPNSWTPDDVYTLVSTSFSKAAPPEVMEYLSKRGWSNDTVNKLMAWMTDNQAGGDTRSARPSRGLPRPEGLDHRLCDIAGETDRRISARLAIDASFAAASAGPVPAVWART